MACGPAASKASKQASSRRTRWLRRSHALSPADPVALRHRNERPARLDRRENYGLIAGLAWVGGARRSAVSNKVAVICIVFVTVALLVVAAPATPVQADGPADPTSGPTIIPSAQNDTSAPLTALARDPGNSGE